MLNKTSKTSTSIQLKAMGAGYDLFPIIAVTKQ